MSSIEKTIQVRVDAFVEELSGLIRQAALEQISSAFGGSAARRGRARPPASPLAAPKAAKNGGRVRRSPEQLEAVGKAVLKFVSGKPGVRVEEISASLGLPTKELTGPIAALLEAKELTKKGSRRATTYAAKK